MYKISRQKNTIIIERPNGEVVAFNDGDLLTGRLREGGFISIEDKHNKQIVEPMAYESIEVEGVSFTDKKVAISKLNNILFKTEGKVSSITYLDTEDLNNITEEGTYVQMYGARATEDRNYPKTGVCRLTVDVLGAKKVQTLTYKDGQIYSRMFKPNGTITEWIGKYRKCDIVRNLGWEVPNEGLINQTPQYYFDKFGNGSMIQESKRNNEVGITGAGEWGRLTTRVGDLTIAGRHHQEYRGNTSARFLVRVSENATTWGAWKEAQFAPMA